MQKEKKQRRMKTYTRYYQEYIMLEISTLGITSIQVFTRRVGHYLTKMYTRYDKDRDRYLITRRVGQILTKCTQGTECCKTTRNAHTM